VTSDTWGVMPPMLIKIPLIRGGAGRWVSNHKTTLLNLAPMHAALLHFKYFSDFHDRVTVAIMEGQHYDAASEYARYAAALRDNAKLSFFYEGSVAYTGSHDLMQRGFLGVEMPDKVQAAS